MFSKVREELTRLEEYFFSEEFVLFLIVDNKRVNQLPVIWNRGIRRLT